MEITNYSNVPYLYALVEQARVQGGGGPKGPGPPLEIEKQKKKKSFQILPPPLRIPGHAPVENKYKICHKLLNLQISDTGR